MSRLPRVPDPADGVWDPRTVSEPGARPDRRPYVVVAGGGTVGHVAPGVAIAEALVARGCPREAVLFVGSARGVEATRVPAAGFEVVLLPGRGIRRRLTVDNVGAVIGLALAFLRAAALLVRRRPAVVLALGGYASVPCVVAAALLRVPIVVAEQNAVPGAANRVAGRFARACAVSFPATPLPRAVLTGNPVRPDVVAVDRSDAGRAAARERLGIGAGRRLVLAYGGSLGARTVNRAVWEALACWADRTDLAVRHAVGDRGWEERPASVSAPTDDDGLQYQPVRYEEDMPTALAAADLVVARAGASTIAELAAAGVPSVLVPLPTAAADHQRVNAEVFAAAGAAVVCSDADLDGARLVELVDGLLTDEADLRRRGAAARSFARPDAAERVAELVVVHAARPVPGWS